MNDEIFMSEATPKEKMSTDQTKHISISFFLQNFNKYLMLIRFLNQIDLTVAPNVVIAVKRNQGR